MANPFAPAQIDIAGGIQGLMQQYQKQQVIAKQQQLETARKDALGRLLSGQDSDPVKMIMGYGQSTGDLEGMQALAAVYKSTRPPASATLTPFQSAQLSHNQIVEAQGDFQKKAAAVPQSRKDYWISNPALAPAWFRQGLDVGGGDTGMPPPEASQPQPTAAAQPAPPEAPARAPLSYEKWQAIQSGKMLSPEQAEKHVNLVTTNLDLTRDFTKRLLENPALDKAFGGIGNVLTRSPSPGAGSGNVLPGWMTAGTPTADVKAAISSLKDHISLAVIANMKEMSSKSGSTGLGRVMQIEYSGWQNALGSLEHAQSPEAVRQSLQTILGYIDRSEANIRDSFANEYGAGGQPQPQGEAPVSPGPSGLPPGYNTINTPPPQGTVPAAAPAAAAPTADPRQMNDQQMIGLARQLRQQGLSKEQIIAWFKAHGVTIEP